METIIVRNHTRYARIPKILEGQQVFVVITDDRRLRRYQWVMRKRQQRDRKHYRIEHAELNGEKGILITAHPFDQTERTDAASIKIGDFLYDWTKVKPGTMVEIPLREISDAQLYYRSLRRYRLKTGRTFYAHHRMTPSGPVFQAVEHSLEI